MTAQNSLNSYRVQFSSAIRDPSSNNFTLSTNVCFYQIVNGLIFFNSELAWSSKGSASGQVRIILPFTSLATASYRGGALIGWTTGINFVQATEQVQLIAEIGNNVSYATLYSLQADGGSPKNLTAADLSSSGEIQISGFYFS